MGGCGALPRRAAGAASPSVTSRPKRSIAVRSARDCAPLSLRKASCGSSLLVIGVLLGWRGRRARDLNRLAGGVFGVERGRRLDPDDGGMSGDLHDAAEPRAAGQDIPDHRADGEAEGAELGERPFRRRSGEADHHCQLPIRLESRVLKHRGKHRIELGRHRARRRPAED